MLKIQDFIFASSASLREILAFHSFIELLTVPAGPHRMSRIDLILITHNHWDHFNADDVAQAAVRTGAIVVGPQKVIKKLSGLVA